ncbi:hypothetical protein C2I18_16795 [Paenibacillus sp. PK3_47]|uniref:hypothetical protein n=1 Tax=Paenibacillus sp. PK3_47 TaxID=2072642 RepID=UPI00201E25F0|nr:hypothetical protein [Paenibacillus sp. PK3_47]UQZ35033.1 hypothetical protein C2I18_16795 [Paenibacillus sp. PK3_47]
MDWLHHYEEDLQAVFNKSSSIISGFPEPLAAQGLAYLDQFNVFKAGSNKNYICYLLPFWLRDEYGITPEAARTMSAGNILLMLYFFLQDDLMDDRESPASGKLPLANLLYVEFLNIYRPLFPPESPFWSYFNRYISEWADSVTSEKTRNYFVQDRIRIAHKASPLKLCSTAVLLLTDRIPLIAECESMLHEVLITLQMVDDYEDWEQDLSDGSYNCLLALVRSSLEAEDFLTQGKVKDFIFTSSGLAAYAGTAADNHKRLEGYSLNIPHLLSFHLVLVKNLEHIASAIEAEKQLLQGGGLGYWLSRHSNL